jgi:hypothetical protein
LNHEGTKGPPPFAPPLRQSLLVFLFLGAVAGVPRGARADLGDTLLAIGYVASVGAGALSTAVNGSYLAFGEPSPRGWRIFGLVAGGVDLAWGAAAYVAAGDRAEGLVVGTIATAVGAASLLTALLVDEADDAPGVRPVAWVAPGGGGIGIGGRF